MAEKWNPHWWIEALHQERPLHVKPLHTSEKETSAIKFIPLSSPHSAYIGVLFLSQVAKMFSWHGFNSPGPRPPPLFSRFPPYSQMKCLWCLHWESGGGAECRSVLHMCVSARLLSQHFSSINCRSRRGGVRTVPLFSLKVGQKKKKKQGGDSERGIKRGGHNWHICGKTTT